MGDRVPQLSLKVVIEKEEDYYQHVFRIKLTEKRLFELASL